MFSTDLRYCYLLYIFAPEIHTVSIINLSDRKVHEWDLLYAAITYNQINVSYCEMEWLNVHSRNNYKVLHMKLPGIIAELLQTKSIWMTGSYGKMNSDKTMWVSWIRFM